MHNLHLSEIKNKQNQGQQTLTHLIDAKKHSSKDPKQVLATGTLVSFVANDLVPLLVVESTCFKEFIRVLDPLFQLPSRKHLSTTLLINKYDDVHVKSAVMKSLKDTLSISLTIDMWSSHQNVVIYRDNWSLHNQSLGIEVSNANL